MIAELLDATSSPSNRRPSVARGIVRSPAPEDQEHHAGTLLTVSSDETTILVARFPMGSFGDEPQSWQRTWERAEFEWELYSGFHAYSGYRDPGIDSYLHGRSASLQEGFERATEALTLSNRILGERSSYDTPDPAEIGANIQESIQAVNDVFARLRRIVELHPEQVQRVREFAADLAEQLERTATGRVQQEQTRRVEQQEAIEQHVWLQDLNRLKELAALTDEEIASLFGVSRGNVQGWLRRGQGMRSHRQRHLLNTLAVVEDSSRRLDGDSRALRHLLLTPVGPSGQTPFDFLIHHKYRTARGYMQNARNQQIGRRPPLRSDVRRAKEDRFFALEALSPSPRVVEGSG